MGTYNQEIPLKQKLKLADAYVKQLKYEIGVLESEKDELAYELEEARKQIGQLMVEKMNGKLSKGEKNKIKRELFGKHEKENRIKLHKTIKSLKKDKETLIIKVLELEKKSDV